MIDQWSRRSTEVHFWLWREWVAHCRENWCMLLIVCAVQLFNICHTFMNWRDNLYLHTLVPSLTELGSVASLSALFQLKSCFSWDTNKGQLFIKTAFLYNRFCLNSVMEKLPSEAKPEALVNFDFKMPTSQADVPHLPPHTNDQSAGCNPWTGIYCKPLSVSSLLTGGKLFSGTTRAGLEPGSSPGLYTFIGSHWLRYCVCGCWRSCDFSHVPGHLVK